MESCLRKEEFYQTKQETCFSVARKWQQFRSELIMHCRIRLTDDLGMGRTVLHSMHFSPIAQLPLTFILYRQPHLAFLLKRSDTRDFLPKL